jgi:hypothetical protein
MRPQGSAQNPGSFSRRVFAGAALASAATVILPAAAAGEDPAPLEPSPELGTKPEDLSAADWEEVQARYANLLRVYGDRLSIEQKHRAASILTTNQHMLASIRTFVVQNGDPSACTLRIYDPDPQTAGR